MASSRSNTMGGQRKRISLVEKLGSHQCAVAAWMHVCFQRLISTRRKNRQDLRGSPYHGATKARVSLEHFDAAINPLDRAEDVT